MVPAAAALDVYLYGAVTVGFDDGGPATVLRGASAGFSRGATVLHDAPGRLRAHRHVRHRADPHQCRTANPRHLASPVGADHRTPFAELRAHVVQPARTPAPRRPLTNTLCKKCHQRATRRSYL